MAVTMTERAAKHVAGFIEKRGKGVGLRLGVRTTGCSGMAYKLEYADSPQPQRFFSRGLLKRNPSFSPSRTKSSSVPSM